MAAAALAERATSPPILSAKTAAIASGQTESAEIDLAGGTAVGVYLPAAFTGTSLSFKAATASGGTFVSIRDGAGNAYSVTVAAAQYVPLDPSKLLGVRFLKIVSGSAEAADRTLTVAARPV